MKLNVILGAHRIYQGSRIYWMFISQNQFQRHITCHWNSLSPSKQWYWTIYWNINDILSQITHVPCYIMGYYNLDLLKHECHRPTEHFLKSMYSNLLLPLIYKPTREPDSTATLIDNTFTNNYDVSDQLYQGIFLMDISDHYGILHILDQYCVHDDSS